MLDAVDIQVMARLAPAIRSAWSAGPWLSTSLFALTAAGMCIGAGFSGVLGDRVGRRPVLLTALVCFSLACLGCAVSPSPEVLLAFRFLTGLGLGAFIPVNTVYLAELLPTRRRGLMLGLWTVGLPLGNLVAATLATVLLPLGGWRSVLLICAVAAVPLFLGLWRLPESPIYLSRRGNHEAAGHAAQWLAGTAPPDFSHPTQPLKDAENRPGLLAKSRRTRTMMLWAIWFAWNFSYFGSVLWMPTILGIALPDLSPFLALAAMAIAGITGRCFSALASNWLGRRYTLLFCATGAVAATITLGLADSPLIWLVAVAALGFFQDGGASAIVTWTPELYPTPLRATGVGAGNAAGRIGAVVSPLVIGSMVSTSAQSAFFALAIAFSIALLLAAGLRIETKGSQLDAIEL